MRCVVTCGPTYEPLDEVRRLTNFSTGKLGIELANYLTDRGHSVTVLLGHYSTYLKSCRAEQVKPFTTTESLLQSFQELSREPIDVVFHAAAVSDFQFGTVFKKSEDGRLEQITSGKFSTREGTLLAELVPTPKILLKLPGFFPRAKIVGWKYEVDGDRATAVEMARKQVRDNGTFLSVVNGPAYGAGYGIVRADGTVTEVKSAEELYGEVEAFVAI